MYHYIYQGIILLKKASFILCILVKFKDISGVFKLIENFSAVRSLTIYLLTVVKIFTFENSLMLCMIKRVNVETPITSCNIWMKHRSTLPLQGVTLTNAVHNAVESKYGLTAI